MTIHAWDVGGRHKLRVLLRLIYKDADAIIFVLDSSDREMFESARAELMDVLGEEDLAGKPLLVFANKRDLPGAVPMAEVIDKLGLHDLRSRKWFIQDLWEKLVSQNAVCHASLAGKCQHVQLHTSKNVFQTWPKLPLFVGVRGN